ncbi:hypothetical protein I6H96_02615 [Brucella anthropi]|uniref:hypothetical protein n=1 Tax=Brucella anthropi TaxID=529 RepID=UPI0002D30C37|nr:hypothetical protein [Brucella anthropi]QQC25774.1 hypothetical protein I6H96_02615 [Brucella anthropi]SUA65477.1 Uncharacterised protein [Brucella anthropi]
MAVQSKSAIKPKADGNYPDRNIDCQEAVASGIIDLIETAENAGWGAVEAARAINEVSRGLFVGLQGKDPDE